MVNNTDFLMLNNPWNKLCLVSMDCFPLDFVSNLFWIFASKFIIVTGQIKADFKRTIRKAKAEGSLEPGRLRLQPALIAPLYSSLVTAGPASKIIIHKSTSLPTVSPSNERAYLPLSFTDLAHVFYLSYFSINAKSNSFSLDIIIALGIPHNTQAHFNH
ncbi:LOW QUALITY PROTEIN: TMEM191C isoform 2 [Pongo abelii]|uniref:TMEM191C isoform 2 n=1 Tax=Pongo abelii TaxID=9601 RepID=A0A2J8RZC8_PONAB|nr:LOW QUALITY PROTEIN: TMEM191C isoform 2 [Pongo abelii]